MLSSSSRTDLHVAAVYLAIIAALGAFYAVLSYGSRQPFFDRNGGWYGEEAAAFQQGRVALLSKPSPGLLADKTPYTMVHPYPYKWDISYYHGKYYLYFGVTPAILLFYPWQAITGEPLNQALAFWLMSLATLVVYALFMRALVRRYFPTVPVWGQGLLLVIFGMCNLEAYSMHYIMMYEIAEISGSLLAMLTFYFIFLALHHPKRLIPYLILISLCWGASVGARPNMFLYGIGLVGLFFYYYKKPVSSVSLYAIAAALALPAMCIGMGLAWFNYVRFGNPLDFGMAYQLSTWDYQQPKIVLRFLPYGLIDFLFMPPRPVLDFPYLYLHPMPHLFNPRTCLGGFAGVFPMFPIFGMALLFPFCPLDRPLQWFCRIVTVSVVLILLYLSCYFYLTYRYFMDFLPLMWMVATIVLFSCHGWLRAHRYYSYAVIAAVAYSLVMGLETAVIGECNGLHSIRMNQHAPKNAPDSEAITEEEEAAAAERDSYIRHKIVSRQIQFTH